MSTIAFGYCLVDWHVTGATLSASPRKLALARSVWRDFDFVPSDVVALELQPGRFGGRLVIRHTRPDYPAHVVFYSLAGTAQRLIDEIHDTGFHPKASADEEIVPRGSAWRASALVTVFVMWNLCFALDDWLRTDAGRGPGFFSGLVLLATFGVATLTHFSAGLQSLLLKRGRAVSEVRLQLGIAQLLSGLCAALVILTP